MLSNPQTTTHPCPDTISSHHTHPVGHHQCCSAVIQIINAPVSTVWSVVRRFDNPQAYKNFVKSCHVLNGSGDVGTLRQVHVISGLPAATSTEPLDILDEERHVSASASSVATTVYPTTAPSPPSTPTPTGNGTVVVESYVVDIPTGNTKEETFGFVDTIVKCNLQSLAKIAENKLS